MERLTCQLLAAASLLFWWSNGEAFGRPRYGGTLRVEIHESIQSIDPADWPSKETNAAKEKLISLLFERLVRLDEEGRPHGELALSWQHDAKFKRWRFRLRTDVRFHDGTALTPELAAAALRASGALRKSDWKPSVLGDTLVIDSDKPNRSLLSDMAQAYYSIFLRGADRKVSGTGPFQLAEWDPGKRAVLAANEQHWAGRPFLDGVSIQMGRPLAQQPVDLRKGDTDFIELWPNEMRYLPENAGIWPSSDHVLNHVLIALAFKQGRPASEDAGLREALSLCIDRGMIYNWLLQKQGEITAALLPQRLSGYAFLFPTGTDIKRAKQLAARPGQPKPSLVLSYDTSDPLALSIANRISVNARDADIVINVAGRTPNADLQLVRIPITTPVPGEALADLLRYFGKDDSGSLPAAPSIEALHSAEAEALADHRVIPLFHVPELFGSSPRLKAWTTTGIDSFGNWRFDDMWLESEKP